MQVSKLDVRSMLVKNLNKIQIFIKRKKEWRSVHMLKCYTHFSMWRNIIINYKRKVKRASPKKGSMLVWFCSWCSVSCLTIIYRLLLKLRGTFQWCHIDKMVPDPPIIGIKNHPSVFLWMNGQVLPFSIHRKHFSALTAKYHAKKF